MDLLFNPCGCFDTPLTWADGCAVAFLIALVCLGAFLVHWGDIKEERKRAAKNAYWKAKVAEDAGRKDPV